MPKIYISLLITLACGYAGCTTPIPIDERSKQGDQQQAERLIGDSDVAAIIHPQGLFSSLAQDPSTLDAWEKSDGWVMLYQGKLYEAIKAFGEPSPSSALGLARAHLELSESYERFAVATLKISQEWLKLERQSPHAELYKAWLDWTELTTLNLSGGERSARSQELLAQLKGSADMAPWAAVIVEPNPELVPPKASSSYRLWLGFAQQVKLARTQDKDALARARKRQARLLKRQGKALIHPLLTVQPDPQHPEHKVFDLRLAAVHRDYHALEALEALSAYEDPWGALLKAQAFALLGDYAQTASLIQGLIAQEKTITAPSESFLLLTSNLSQDDVLSEARARLTQALCALGNTTQASTLVQRLSQPSTQTVNATIWRLWAIATCPTIDARDRQMTDAQLKLFPKLRRPLVQAALEGVQGPAAVRLASLGVAERWVDELQHRYGYAMSLLDKRVPALNALSSAEDSRAPMRLGGRNRLNRLALSATHQINLRRLRVASKYFLRLREQLPSVAALAEMTSDVLSGTSFSATGQVNAGQ